MLEAVIEHLEMAQKRVVEEMAEMRTADDALEHGRKAGPQRGLRRTWRCFRSTSGTICQRCRQCRWYRGSKMSGNGRDGTESSGHRGSGNSAEGVGSDEWNGAEVLEQQDDRHSAAR